MKAEGLQNGTGAAVATTGERALETPGGVGAALASKWQAIMAMPEAILEILAGAGAEKAIGVRAASASRTVGAATTVCRLTAAIRGAQNTRVSSQWRAATAAHSDGMASRGAESTRVSRQVNSRTLKPRR